MGPATTTAAAFKALTDPYLMRRIVISNVSPFNTLLSNNSKFSKIRQASRVVLLFDGLHVLDSNKGLVHVNARHNRGDGGSRRGSTNLLFADSHAESVSRSELPPGGINTDGPAGLTLLRNHSNDVLWRLDEYSN